MKVLIAPMIWKRPEVFDVHVKAIEILKETFEDVKFDLFYVGSEEDVSKKRVEEKGYDYFEFKNHPLAEKAQFRLEKARERKADYMLFLSDDDFITPAYFAYLLDKMYQGYEYIAPYDIYYIRNGGLYYSEGYPKGHKRHGEPMAVGRCVSTEVMDKLDWDVWNRINIDRGLDRYAYVATMGEAKSIHFFKAKDIGGLVVDIKSSVNKTAWQEKSYKLVTKELNLLLDERITELLEKVPESTR